MSYNNAKSKIINLKIAEFVICVHFHESKWKYPDIDLKRQIIYYLKDFIVTNAVKPNFFIHFTTDNKITIIKSKLEGEYFVNFFSIKDYLKCIYCYYRISFSEFRIILNIVLSELLRKHNGFFLHASSLLIDDKASIFLAKSGGGKSTIVKLLKNTYTPLSDDIVIIKKINSSYYLFQTPFLENNHAIDKNSRRYSIGNMYFLSKGEYKITRMKNKDNIISCLVRQLTVNHTLHSSDGKREMSTLINFTAHNNRFYKLRFSKRNDKKLKDGLLQQSK